MTMLSEGNHSKYDVAMMNWGQHDASTRQRIQEVFDYRITFIRTVFKELGFTGDELEMRVQTMVFFQTMECSQYTHLSKDERLRYVSLRHRMLIQR